MLEGMILRMYDVEVLGYEDYVTAEHDTFDLIAWKKYGDEMLASLIIESNLDYADIIVFDAGVKLTIPVVEQSNIQQAIPPWRQ